MKWVGLNESNISSDLIVLEIKGSLKVIRPKKIREIAYNYEFELFISRMNLIDDGHASSRVT